MLFPSNPTSGQVVTSVAQSFIYQNGGWVSQPILPSGLAQDSSLQSILTATLATPVLPANAAQDSSLQSILSAIKATVNLTGTVWYDSTVTPTLFYVRRETVNEGTGVITVSWETPAGITATPNVANLVAVANAANISTETQTFTAITTGTGYVSGDILFHTYGLDTTTTPATLAYSIWLNAGPSINQGTIINAPASANIIQAVQPVSGAVSVSGSVSVSNFPSFPATQVVSGSVSVSNFPATGVSAAGTTATIAQGIQGVTGGVPLVVSGATAIGVALTNPPLAVSGLDGGGLKRAFLTDVNGVQAVALSSLPSLAAGTAAIGQVSTSKSRGPISVSGVATAGTYASGRSVAGIITIPIFAAGGQYAGTLSQLSLTMLGGTNAILQAFIFSKAPTSSITDNGVAAISMSDMAYCVAQFPIAPVSVLGTSALLASQTLALSVNNQDTVASGNLYVVLVANIAITIAITGLYVSLNAAQDL